MSDIPTVVSRARSLRAHETHKLGFTIIELLVVVSIIALLIGLLLPAIGKARDTAKTTQSLSNLRNIAAALATYEVDYQRHVTWCKDDLGLYGGNPDNYPNNAHPFPITGYQNGTEFTTVRRLSVPIVNQNVFGVIIGSHRLVNAYSINQYMNGRIHDPVFYAPKDTQVFTLAETYNDEPDVFIESQNGAILWSSYSLSSAAMFNPSVFGSPLNGGAQDPTQIPGAYRCPSSDQARYPDLKTHVMEQHWLQGKRVECNPFVNGAYHYQAFLDCEPVYAHHTFLSTPMTLFYDGHVRGLGAREAFDASQRHVDQAGYGLWTPHPDLGSTGGTYLGQAYYGPDNAAANNSFHHFTTDGIKGRDTLSEG